MRNAIITGCVLIAISISAGAQFTLVPQIGLDQSRTNVTINKLTTFSPLNSQFSSMAMLRLEYKFKSGHGPFAGIATSRSAIAVNFTNPDQLVSGFTAYRKELKLRLDAGYQLKTNPIYLKKSSSTQKASAKSSKSADHKYSSKKTNSIGFLPEFQGRQCGQNRDYFKSTEDKDKSIHSKEMYKCCRQKSHCRKGPSKDQCFSKNKELPYLKLQPMAGISFIPAAGNTFEKKIQGSQTLYTYNAGNWNTAFFTGIGVEFGKGNRQSFLISLQYLKGIGNMGNKTLQTETGNKTINTLFTSRTSQWNITAGFPISLTQKQIHKRVSSSSYKCIKPDWQIRNKGCYQSRPAFRRSS